jgi:hypothetical protein
MHLINEIEVINHVLVPLLPSAASSALLLLFFFIFSESLFDLLPLIKKLGLEFT